MSYVIALSIKALDKISQDVLPSFTTLLVISHDNVLSCITDESVSQDIPLSVIIWLSESQLRVLSELTLFCKFQRILPSLEIEFTTFQAIELSDCVALNKL